MLYKVRGKRAHMHIVWYKEDRNDYTYHFSTLQNRYLDIATSLVLKNAFFFFLFFLKKNHAELLLAGLTFSSDVTILTFICVKVA